jgi:hypothetical protein
VSATPVSALFSSALFSSALFSSALFSQENPMTPMITPSDRPVPGSVDASPVLASNAERDAVTRRLQVAFAEHRLNDEEFDERIRLALTARTTTELDRLTADLPASAPAQVIPAARSRTRGRLAIAMKSSITRGGRWTVPERLTCVVYKGSGLLDLRAAERTAPVTTIVAVAYKSRTQILLPPGLRVEVGGTGVSIDADESSAASPAARDAPVVRIQGMAYKGTIEVTTRPVRSPSQPPHRSPGRPT